MMLQHLKVPVVYRLLKIPTRIPNRHGHIYIPAYFHVASVTACGRGEAWGVGHVELGGVREE